jgi:hypothetical protein
LIMKMSMSVVIGVKITINNSYVCNKA